MRKRKSTLVLFLSFLYLSVSADILPDDYYYIEKCVQITNVDSFPELVLVGLVNDVTSSDYNMLIVANECLERGYKHNSITLFGVHSDYMVDKTLESVVLPNDPHFLAATCDVGPQGYSVSDSTPISKITDYYKIIGFTEDSIIMHKWKEVYNFYDSDQDSTAYYEYVGDTQSLYQIIPLGIGDKKSVELSIYPNPVNDELNIKVNNNYSRTILISFYALNGQLVHSVEKENMMYSEELQLDMNNLDRGVYFMEMCFGDKKEVRKIIVE